MRQQPRIQVTMALDPATVQQLEREAHQKNTRVTPLIRSIVERHVAEQKQQTNGGQSQS